MYPLPPELAQQFATLQAQFCAGLPARQAEIEAAHGLGAVPQHPQALLAALHRLAGAATSFGFPALSAAARAAEKAVRDVSSDVRAAPELHRAMAGLRKALAETRPPVSCE